MNLFCANKILIELLPSGGFLKLAWFQPVRLLRYETHGLFTKVTEVLFISYLLVFLIKEGRNLKRQKKEYFRQFSNWLEIILIVLCLTATICYFFRQAATNTQIKVRVCGTGLATVMLQLEYIYCCSYNAKYLELQ